jgi:hypothetical protein
MFTKATITLSALILFGVTATAVAYEDPENKIGDRYPTLEQRYTPVAPGYGAANRTQTSIFDRHMSEDSENKIGDRYPFLEQTYASRSARSLGSVRIMSPKLDQYANEVPENKISDRFPFLEQPIQSASVASKVTRVAMRSAGSVKKTGTSVRNRKTAQHS